MESLPQRQKEELKEGLKLSLSAGGLKLNLEADRADELDKEFFDSLQRFFDLADQECISKRKFEEMHKQDAFVQNAMSLGLVIFFALMLIVPVLLSIRHESKPTLQQSSTEVISSC